MDSPISYEELNSALAKLKLNKFPGPYCITNEMIIKLGTPALYKLIEIFHKSWEDGSLPHSWRKATMIPIHRPGKAKTETTSYRPISLTSCMVKLLELIINTRLKWFFETEKLLVPQQAEFREHQCTEDQTTYLTQEMDFNVKKTTLSVWIDFKKEFDKVRTDQLLQKLKRCNISGNMFKWIKSYTHNRIVNIVIDNNRNKK